MVHRILQLKQSNSAIYAHEIRSELQKEFGKIVDGNYIGPVVPSVSSINRILRTNSDPSSMNEPNSSSQLPSTGQLSSFYYPPHFAAPSSALSSTIAPKHLPSYAPSSSAAPSSFGNLYDPFSAVNGLSKNESAWPNSSLSSNSSFSSGYSSSYSSGSNSPLSSGSSSGSSSPTEFDSFGFGSSLKNDSNLPSHYASSAHLSLLNGLLSKPAASETSQSMNAEPAAFGTFHRPSQTSLPMNGLQQSSSKSSLYYSMAGASSSMGTLSSKKRSRKYNSYHIHEILRKSDEEDIDEEEDLNVVNDE